MWAPREQMAINRPTCQQRNQPANTSISEFYFLESWENKFVMFKLKNKTKQNKRFGSDVETDATHAQDSMEELSLT
jgi:hypothetical protein